METQTFNSQSAIPLRKVSSGAKEYLLLGTAHVSQESIRHVQEAIRLENPDRVCVELDAGRLKALTDTNRWKSLDLKAIIRQGQLSTLVANLMLSSYQKRMGQDTGAKPGEELLTAVQSAESAGIPVDLVDREVKLTLRRAWRMTPFYRKILLLGTLLESLFDRTHISEEQLREIREQDTLSAMMDELGKSFPEVKQVVIEERDQFLAGRIRSAQGNRILAVVGAGHIEGIVRILQADLPTTPESELTHVPPPNPLFKWMLYSIPVAFLAAMGYLGYTKGLAELGNNILYWVLVTGSAGALGASLALPHPLVILVAFVMAPLKPFRPVVGTGVFTSLTQAWLIPPKVEELESVAEDINHLKMWWKNRLLRIVLCALLPVPFTALGYFIAGKHIVQNMIR